jgi:phage recombination protein Bet
VSKEPSKTADEVTSTAGPGPGAAPTIGQALMPRPRFDPATKQVEIPLPFDGGSLFFDPTAKALTKDQITLLAPAKIKPDYDPAYVVAFLVECAARGLDPFAGEAFLMRYKTRTGPEYVRHIGINGMLRIAEESGEFEGMDPVEFCGPDGVFMQVWPHTDKPPYAARATAYRRGRRPSTVVAIFDEYCPLEEDKHRVQTGPDSWERRPTGLGKVPTPMWQTASAGGKATVMISKCARAASLRLLFPRRFTGFYEPAELERTAGEFRDFDNGETADARRAAYAEAQRTVDGAEVGAEVRETVTVHDGPAWQRREFDSAPDDKPGLRPSEVRALLLAELDAQARLLGKDRAWMTARWSEARGGQPFETASVATMTAHVHRYRTYLIDRLRETGRHQLAEAYHRAPLAGTLEELFGTDEPWTVVGEQAHPGRGRKTGAGDVAADEPVGASA